MARAAKVFTGYVGYALTAIYTVPAGRVAKLIPAYFKTSGTHNGYARVQVNSVPIFVPNGQVAGFPVVCWQGGSGPMDAGSEAVILGAMSGVSAFSLGTVGGNIAAIPKEIFMNAGDKLEIADGYYSFAAIEEY